MREIGKIAENLFEKVRSRFESVSLGDEKANTTTDPVEARFFNFSYIDKDGKNYGNIHISIVDPASLKIYFARNFNYSRNIQSRYEIIRCCLRESKSTKISRFTRRAIF